MHRAVMRLSPKPIRPLLVAALAAGTLLSACATWHRTTEPAARAAFDSTKSYRVTLANGQRLVAAHPVLSGDSLTWAERVSEATFPPPTRRAVPLSDIREVEVQGGSGVATILVVWLSVGILIAMLKGVDVTP